MSQAEKESNKNLAGVLLHKSEAYLCLTIADGSLDITSDVSQEQLSIMILGMMQSREDYAQAVNFAALTYARNRMGGSINPR